MEQLSKDDIRITGQFEPEVFWQKFGSTIIWSTVAVLALGIAIFLWQHRVTQEAERAAASLAEAKDVGALENVVRTYPGKEVAAQALLRLGEMQFQAGKYSEAAAAYQRLLDQFPQHPLAESAQFGLAAVQEALGNLTEARNQYSRVANSYPNGYTRLAAKLGAARCTEALGELKEARQMYEELMAQAQGTPWYQAATLRWIVLRRELPPEQPSQTTTQQTAPAPIQAPPLQLPAVSAN